MSEGEFGSDTFQGIARTYNRTVVPKVDCSLLSDNLDKV